MGSKRVNDVRKLACADGWSSKTMYNAAATLGVLTFWEEGYKWWKLAPTGV